MPPDASSTSRVSGRRAWLRFALAAVIACGALWMFVWTPVAIALTQMGECAYPEVECNPAGELLATDAGFALGSLAPLTLGVGIAIAVRPPSSRRRPRRVTKPLVATTAALWAIGLASTGLALTGGPLADVVAYGTLAWLPAALLTPPAALALVLATARRFAGPRRPRRTSALRRRASPLMPPAPVPAALPPTPPVGCRSRSAP